MSRRPRFLGMPNLVELGTDIDSENPPNQNLCYQPKIQIRWDQQTSASFHAWPHVLMSLNTPRRFSGRPFVSTSRNHGSGISFAFQLIEAAHKSSIRSNGDRRWKRTRLIQVPCQGVQIKPGHHSNVNSTVARLYHEVVLENHLSDHHHEETSIERAISPPRPVAFVIPQPSGRQSEVWFVLFEQSKFPGLHVLPLDNAAASAAKQQSLL